MFLEETIVTWRLYELFSKKKEMMDFLKAEKNDIEGFYLYIWISMQRWKYSQLCLTRNNFFHVREKFEYKDWEC